ncbi:MAG: T9SS type A sorting domain-containing protein [Ignavibacteriae bacterium]|nr:T9SS type A sorting domain-containing protein [Ignavibacteriota bacterium]
MGGTPVQNRVQRVVFLLLLSAMLFASEASAQQYTRVTTDDWAEGIDYATPFIVDIDGDAKLDLLVGSSAGPIRRFEQSAPLSITFTLVDGNFLNHTNESESAVTGADLDADGKLDLLVGNNDGKLYHYRQRAANGEEFELVTSNFANIDIGAHAVPTLTDFEGDGLYDLVVTESSSPVHLFRQKAPGSLEFIAGKPDMFQLRTSYPSACFADLDADGRLDALFPNGNNGTIRHYVQDAVVKDSFILAGTDFSGISGHPLGVACARDLNADGRLELLIGDRYGRVVMYGQTAAGSLDFSTVLDSRVIGIRDYGSEQCIAATDLDADGLLDILIATLVDDNAGRSAFARLEQDRAGSLSFSTQPITVAADLDGGWPGFGLHDIDANGRIDMIYSRAGGYLSRLEQRNGRPDVFDLVTPLFSGGIDPPGNATFPSFVDLDGNGRLDMLLNTSNRKTLHYEQNAANDTAFTLVSDELRELNNTYYPYSSFRRDAVTGRLVMVRTYANRLTLYAQDSVRPSWFNAIGTIPGLEIRSFPQPVFADINADGVSDLLVGNQEGGISLFLGSGPSAASAPASPSGLRIRAVYPQPAATEMWVDLGATPGLLDMSIHDVLGRSVRTFTAVNSDVTDRIMRMDVSALPAGPYLLRVRGGVSESARLISIGAHQ